jgi:hypothetical protein
MTLRGRLGSLRMSDNWWCFSDLCQAVDSSRKSNDRFAVPSGMRRRIRAGRTCPHPPLRRGQSPANTTGMEAACTT